MSSVILALSLIAAASTDSSAVWSDPSVQSEFAKGYCSQTSEPYDAPKPSGVVAKLDAEKGVYPEEQVLEAMIISAAIDIARATSSRESCEATFDQGRTQFEERLQGFTKQLRKKRHRLSRKEAIRTVQQDITDLWVEDQASRSTYIALQTKDRRGAPYWAQRLSVLQARKADRQSREYMQRLLQEWDWIDRKRFGNAVSDHAWILVQHADADPDFQAQVLKRMEPFLETNGVRRKHYAYLWDRVAVNTGKLQRYGTQPDWNCVDGKMQLKPLEAPETVNERRSQMGLNTVEAGLAEMERGVCR